MAEKSRPASLLQVGQQPAYSLGIHLGNQRGLTQIPFPIGRLLGQDVRGKGFGAANPTGTGGLKPFGGASVGFHFRHGMHSLHDSRPFAVPELVVDNKHFDFYDSINPAM
jgi:hypothetical protein